MSREPACNAGDARDMGLIPLEKGMGYTGMGYYSILAWKIP